MILSMRCNIVFSSTFQVINPRDIKIFVLDEADEMLSRGFKDQIYDIFRTLPGNIQVCTINMHSTYAHNNNMHIQYAHNNNVLNAF